ncbi:efflux RND transporter periplasmic adaptor subunit [Roseovarius sp. M141]|uniref:efflux RND transporter periplasmic adaptor subunit n=1 Tax=Roseovarius sp. M141 TaxID=2583806 RepID=UPI0020CE054F|nr:efflux RND transporter periplasmic adaptor subunit [Roseovarius sp. M141]MCQ0091590.1 efflux RND transporter periplasmic adaptor subunit [Roseovarius sp. M141]
MTHFLSVARRVALLIAPLVLAVPALAQQGDRPPPAVTVVTVEAQDVDLTTTLPGRVVASAEAEVRPQVAGIITERLFHEGGRVEEGDILYKIDPASYDAAVAQAKAAVAQAQAQVKASRREAERLETLSQRNVISEQALDSAIADRDGAIASLQAAQAQLQSAEIEKDRTMIRARLSGEIGRSMVSPGALVTASQQSPLATVRNIDPVYVDVTQSAAEMLDFRRGNRGDQTKSQSQEVKLTLADGTVFKQSGHLTAAEPVVNPLTGVVVLRITFDNPDQLLLPGMYVQAEMPSGQAEGAFLVPQEGVSRNRRGQPTALVVGQDGTVEQRVLTVQQDLDRYWVVTDGLKGGDRIIVDGLQKASPGAVVTPQERESAEAATAAPDMAAPEQAAPEPEAEPEGDPAAPEKPAE